MSGPHGPEGWNLPDPNVLKPPTPPHQQPGPIVQVLIVNGKPVKVRRYGELIDPRDTVHGDDW